MAACWARTVGQPFNSIVQLEYEQGVPRSPFINAGSIVVTDILLANAQPREAISATVRFVRSLADDDAVFVDKAVAKSETETGFRNMALAADLKSCGNLDNPVDLKGLPRRPTGLRTTTSTPVCDRAKDHLAVTAFRYVRCAHREDGA
jgi:hypothetical protein